MTAVLPVPSSDSDALKWRRARAAVHAWRGEMIDVFAYAEAEVSETLLAMDSLSGAATRSVLLVGQRFAQLAEAVSEGGAHVEIGKYARHDLATFRRHEALRPALCHGIAHVALDERGEWIAVFRTLVLRASGADRTNLVVTKTESAELLDDVRACGHRLGGQLRRMRRELAAADGALHRKNCGDKAALLSPAP